MSRQCNTSPPLGALFALMALGAGGCNVAPDLQGGFDFSALPTPAESQTAAGEVLVNLTQRQSEAFRLKAGGAAYKLNLDTGELFTFIYDDTHGDASEFIRDDGRDSVAISVGFNIDLDTDKFITFLQTFESNDLDAEQTRPFKSYTDSFAGSDSEVVFKMSVVEPGEAILDLQYATFGSWSEERGGMRQGGFFYSGVPTTAASMPKSGSASYAGLTIGTVIDVDSNVSSLEGDMALAVNFADGSVNGDFTNMMQTAADGTTSAWRDFSMTASINLGSDNFTGTTATNDGLLSGLAEGAFYGPGAAEVAGAWTLAGAGETAVGGFGGGKK